MEKFVLALAVFTVISLSSAQLLLPGWSCYGKCTENECCQSRVGASYYSHFKKCVAYNKIGESCDAQPLSDFKGCGCQKGLVCINNKCSEKPEGWTPSTRPTPTTTASPYDGDKLIEIRCAELMSKSYVREIKTLLEKYCKK